MQFGANALPPSRGGVPSPRDHALSMLNGEPDLLHRKEFDLVVRVSSLFVSQCIDRVCSSSLASRIKAEENTNRKADTEGEDDRRG